MAAAAAADGEPGYCGRCVAACELGTYGWACPFCRAFWVSRLTEPEARAFAAAWRANPAGGLDRLCDGWAAVQAVRDREAHRPAPAPAPALRSQPFTK